MRLSAIVTVYSKEMLDMVRDRRTLMTMVLVPIAVIPVLLQVMSLFTRSNREKAEEEAMVIAARPGAADETVLATLRGAGFKIVDKDNPREAVEKKDAPAGIDTHSEGGLLNLIEVYADETRTNSRIAADRVRTTLEKLKEQRIKSDLDKAGIPEKVLHPFIAKRVNTAPQKKMAGFFWGTILGYVVILLMFTGGMYPAIDMTAGEKERRTLEAFLAAPVGRSEIVMGKILAVMTAAITTGILTMFSMVASFRSARFSNSAEFKTLAGSMPLDAQTVAMMIVVLIPVALMAASLTISIGVFAKTYKEAQSYLTSLIFVVIFPAIVGTLPGLDFSPTMALIPIFNVSQVIKAIFLGEVAAKTFAIAFASSVAYSAIAFAVAVRIFRNEKVLFRS